MFILYGMQMLQENETNPFINSEKRPGSVDLDGRYQTLFEQVNAAVFLTALDGKILEANLKSCELLGYSWDELIRMSLRDILPASADWSQLVEDISARGGYNIEAENICKDGSYVPVQISFSLFRMKGKPIMMALIQDITERKKAEKKLKESEQKYRGLFEYTTDGLMVLDARGEILDVNDQVLQIFGCKRENMVGANFLNLGLLTPKSLSIVVKQFEELLSGRIAKTHETEIKNKDGNILSVEVSSFFLQVEYDEVVNFVLIIRDISDRKQAEIRLMKEHELLQTLMDNIPDSVYFKDEHNKFVMVNKSKAAYSNARPEDMIGKTDFDFLTEGEAKKIFEEDENLIKTGKMINKIEKLRGLDGSEIWVSITKIPRFDEDGSIIGMMGISRDITDLKKEPYLEQAIEQKIIEQKKLENMQRKNQVQ